MSCWGIILGRLGFVLTLNFIRDQPKLKLILQISIHMCFSRSGRSAGRLLWSAPHLCLAQQSIAMCQQSYLPYPRAEGDSGRLVSTGKPMSGLVSINRNNNQLKSSFPLYLNQSVKHQSQIDPDKHRYSRTLRWRPFWCFLFWFILVILWSLQCFLF